MSKKDDKAEEVVKKIMKMSDEELKELVSFYQQYATVALLELSMRKKKEKENED